MTTLSPELLRRFDIPGPRYTSYPTADRFVEAFTAADYGQALAQRRTGPAALALPLSLYVHIPFCESLCTYCGCNKKITTNHKVEDEYLDLVDSEVRDSMGLVSEGQYRELVERLRGMPDAPTARIPFRVVEGQVHGAFALGTVQLGMPYGAANRTGQPPADEGIRIVRAAIERGVTHVDTARAYGDSERVVGEALAGAGARPLPARQTRFDTRTRPSWPSPRSCPSMRAARSGR